jgi:hypothetical protein
MPGRYGLPGMVLLFALIRNPFSALSQNDLGIIEIDSYPGE